MQRIMDGWIKFKILLLIIGGFNPFRMLQGDFGPFDPYGNMQRMRSVNLDDIPAGSEKVVRDQNGEGVYFKYEIS